jgi:SIT family siderophore-iron:H+ symporter-like MFS transporter
LIVTKVRRLKGFIVVGCCLFATAFGILIRFRSGTSGQVGGVIAAEIMLGIGGGMFSYPTLVSVQSRTKHARKCFVASRDVLLSDVVDVAVVTGLYLASYRLGSALGQTLAGAVWTQRMPIELLSRIGNETIAQATYNAPYATIELYPSGTAERTGMVESYAAVQRILASELIIKVAADD